MRGSRLRVGVLAAGVLVLTALTLAATPKVAPGNTGEKWEVTSQLSMEGMPMQMPAQTQTVCAPKNWKEPPGAQNPGQNCQIRDLQSTAARTTWKMTCTSPDMSGEGEVTRTGPGAFSGSIKMTSEEGNVAIKLSGNRTGECDYQDTEMSPAQSQAANQKLDADLEKMRADGCRGVAESLQLPILKLENGGCNDPATREIYCDTVYSVNGTQALIKQGDTLPGSGLTDAFAFCGNATGKAAYCARFGTTAGFEQFASGGTGAGSPQATIAGYCGLSAAQVDDEHSKLCKMAAGSMTEFHFLAHFCPDEARPLAQKECAGRSFTGASPSPYAQFCREYAVQEASTPPAPAAQAEDSKGKKAKKFFNKVWPH